MSFWSRLKAKHWDETTYSDPEHFGIDAPRFRRCVQWFARLWKEQPLALLGTAAGLIVAVATLIRLFR